MSNHDERNADPIQTMLQLVQNFTNLKARGFKESYRSDNGQDLIYDSEWCRINLVWGGWDELAGNSISIYYGRLHAPNNGVKMTWRGEACHTWHRFEHALHFLDGRCPQEAAEMDYFTPLTTKYCQEEYRQKFCGRQSQWLMQMHMEAWEQYGCRLFELFDLRQPRLWDQYREFLKAYYDIKGRPSFMKPAMDKVC